MQGLLMHSPLTITALLFVTVVHCLSRVHTEERMMLEQFGEAYEEYMRKTGRIMPHFVKAGSE